MTRLAGADTSPQARRHHPALRAALPLRREADLCYFRSDHTLNEHYNTAFSKSTLSGGHFQTSQADSFVAKALGGLPFLAAHLRRNEFARPAPVSKGTLKALLIRRMSPGRARFGRGRAFWTQACIQTGPQ